MPGLQAEVLKYLTQRFLVQRERDFIRQLFNVLDEEKDGELEPDELIKAFKDIYQLELQPRQWANVIKNVDFQLDGNIQFTEFLVAATKKVLLFTQENLVAAFHYFDTDRDGRITTKDLANILNVEHSQVHITDIGKSYVEMIHREVDEEQKI